MVIAHLYKDLLNLYGNDGNSKLLAAKLASAGEEVETVCPSIGDSFDFDKYDIIIIGSGTERAQLLAIKDILRYKNEFANYINSGKPVLALGNAIAYFGEGLYDGDKLLAEGLGIFDYRACKCKRIKADLRRATALQSSELLGYENREFAIFDRNGKELSSQEFISNNFYGVYAEGPLLVRNPEFFAKLIALFTDKAVDLELENRAYDNFIKILNGDYA